MRELGLDGVAAGNGTRTTTPTRPRPGPADLVEREFTPTGPDQLWVADFTYVPTWSGIVYVAFVIDVYSRRILGWRAATTCAPSWSSTRWRWRSGPAPGQASPTCPGWSTTPTPARQYTSIAFTERLAEAGAAPSVGIGRRRLRQRPGRVRDRAVQDRADPPPRTLAQASTTSRLATLEWVDWFNHRRLHSACADLTPAEYEQLYYVSTQPRRDAGPNIMSVRTRRDGSMAAGTPGELGARAPKTKRSGQLPAAPHEDDVREPNRGGSHFSVRYAGDPDGLLRAATPTSHARASGL